MKTFICLCLLALTALSPASAQGPVARFTAQEAATTYYQQGWDSQEETATWTYTGQATGNYTWHLSPGVPYSGQQPFSSIEAGSSQSLCISYAPEGSAQDEQATSPELLVLPGSHVEFYACFRSVFFLPPTDWRLYVTDVEKQETTQLLSGFLWAQQNEFTGPSWQHFDIDLAAYAGRRCTFTFRYIGPDAEDLAIDGFKLYAQSSDAEAVVSIQEGGLVHFWNLSEGNGLQYQWRFEGGQPRVSQAEHPVVMYGQAGVYGVSLTVSNAQGSDTMTREGFVVVRSQAPMARLGLPGVGYLSPWVAEFIPAGVPVTYHDLSVGQPTEWSWTFPGGDPSESSEQNPTVTYTEPGLYGMALTVGNAVGTSQDFMVRALQVGGSQYVWNVTIDEQELLGEIALGFYGYYGGSNYLGMTKFAEHFDKPMDEVEIDSVQVFFTRTQMANANTPITVSICLPDADGKPGEVLASGSVKAGQLVNDPNYYLPTGFALNRKVRTESDFFVVVEGMPVNSQTDDDVCIMALRRNEGGKTTAWHLLEDEDPHTYQPLGTYTWYENEDDPVSLAITPHLAYVRDIVTAVSTASACPSVHVVYDLQGRRHTNAHSDKGLFVIRQTDGSVRKVVRRN